MLKKESGRTQVGILKDIIESLTQAIGAASQLIHVSGNPAFFMHVRESLELTKEGISMLAPQGLVMGSPTGPKVII